MKLYNFEVATIKDIDEIISIEEEFFENGVAYTKEFIITWMKHNPNMFFVVKDNNLKIKGFTILAPITEECYQKLKNNEITDMINFKQTDVLNTIQSEYYYFADIASSKKDSLASISLLHGIQKHLSQNAHFIAATPITEDGVRISKYFGFGPTVEKGKNCFKEVTIEVKENHRFGFKKRRIKE